MEAAVTHYTRQDVLKSPEVRLKASKTIYQKYRVCNVSQSDVIKEKKKQSSLLKYGTENPMQSQEVKEKRKQTNIERYGGPSPMASSEVKAAAHETIEKRKEETRSKLPTNLDGIESEFEGFDTKHPKARSKKKEVSGIIQKREKGYSDQTDVLFDKVVELQSNKISDLYESEESIYNSWSYRFEEVLKKTNIKYEKEFKLVEEKEYLYEFVIPDERTLIKLEPTWISNCYAIVPSGQTGFTRDRFLQYSKVAQKNGYRCLHVFDWESRESVIALLKNSQQVYARKCAVMEIDVKTTNKFEDANHIQGHCTGQRKCYGLFYKGELVEVMTFGKPRYNRKFQWELMRLCSKTGVKVVGGASKLFKYFLQSENPDSIISYCDRAKFNGDVYLKIGMYLDHTTEPNKIWSSGTEYVTNNFLLQRGFDQIFEASYGKGTSNEELMLLSGWLPVYDCGQNVYGWRKK